MGPKGRAEADGGRITAVADAQLKNDYAVRRTAVQLPTGPDRAREFKPVHQLRLPPISPWEWSMPALVALSAVVLAAAVVSPMAVDAPALRSAVETVILVCAVSGMWMFHAQFIRGRRLRDLLLFATLLLLAVMQALAYVAPVLLSGHHTTQFSALAAWGKVFVAGGLAAAAVAPESRLVSSGRRPGAAIVAVSLAAVGAAELLSRLVQGAQINPPDDPVIGVTQSVMHPLACGVVLGTAALCLLAGSGFARTARRDEDPMSALLAGACLVYAASWLYYFPLPGLAYDWVSPREGLRLFALALVLAAAVGSEFRVRAEIAKASELAERRRVAQDLHDGIGQDLAVIAAHSARMAEQLGSDHPVAVAARRALAVSRETIGQLSDPKNATTAEALEAVAGELGDRFAMTVAVRCDKDAELEADRRQQLTRIAREAIANAGRHGEAKHVLVSLRSTHHGLVLRVEDDGRGLAPSASDGFGINSMRERAAAMGGSMTVRPGPRRGTEVEVVVF